VHIHDLSLALLSFLTIVEDICYVEYLTFTPFFVQTGLTVLMFAANGRAGIKTMQLLLDSGAAASINAQDKVALLCSHLAV
jgi:hypothetical protein